MTRRSLAITTVALVVVAGAAYLLGRATSRPGTSAAGPAAAPVGSQQVYTCSMHPQIRLDRPGNCPICEMPLIAAAATQSGSNGEPMLQLSEHALAMASVETTSVTRRELSRALHAVGKIQYNEPSLATVTARVDGYAERLFANFTGVEIRAGDHLAEVYSPDLLVAQRELLTALQVGAGGAGGALAEMSRLKLLRWGLTEVQVKALIESRKLADRVTLYSPITGTIVEKLVVQNSAFKAGDALYRVANLDIVWVYLDVYEYDLAWVRYGQRVEITAEAIPGRAFEGLVTFVQPLVNEETRTVRVPVHVANQDHALKPGMFVSAVITSALASDGRAAPTGVEGRFSCPMHPQVLQDTAGHCPDCEMPLEQIPGTGPATAAQGDHAGHVDREPSPATAAYACPMKCEGEKTYDKEGRCPVCSMKLQPVAAAPPPSGPGLLAVPASAVLDSGTRRLVYVERSRGLFEPRAVVLGPRAGEFFPVLSGLAEGERVATRGGFLIDSQFQITGHPSLFYPGGLMGGQAGYQHGGVSSAGSAPAPDTSTGAAPPPAAAAPHKH